MLSIKPEIQEILKERWQPPKVFENFLSSEELAFLQNDEKVSLPRKVIPSREFGLDTSRAQVLLKDKLSNILDYPFSVTGGNYFNTIGPFLLHADTGIDENAKLYRIIVLPLLFETDGEYVPEFNCLTVMEQRWYNQAAFFMKGEEEKFEVKKQEYNQPVSDYSDIYNKSNATFSQERFDEMYSHLTYQSFENMSELMTIPWIPGNALTFDRSNIHTASNFYKANVTRKIGLTFFLEYSDI